MYVCMYVCMLKPEYEIRTPKLVTQKLKLHPTYFSFGWNSRSSRESKTWQGSWGSSKWKIRLFLWYVKESFIFIKIFRFHSLSPTHCGWGFATVLYKNFSDFFLYSVFSNNLLDNTKELLRIRTNLPIMYFNAGVFPVTPI